MGRMVSPNKRRLSLNRRIVRILLFFVSKWEKRGNRVSSATVLGGFGLSTFDLRLWDEGNQRSSIIISAQGI
jgi:hypothetical protein